MGPRKNSPPWSEDQERSAQAQERRPQGSSWKRSTGDEELTQVEILGSLANFPEKDNSTELMPNYLLDCRGDNPEEGG